MMSPDGSGDIDSGKEIEQCNMLILKNLKISLFNAHCLGTILLSCSLVLDCLERNISEAGGFFFA